MNGIRLAMLAQPHGREAQIPLDIPYFEYAYVKCMLIPRDRSHCAGKQGHMRESTLQGPASFRPSRCETDPTPPSPWSFHLSVFSSHNSRLNGKMGRNNFPEGNFRFMTSYPLLGRITSPTVLHFVDRTKWPEERHWERSLRHNLCFQLPLVG